MPNAQEGESQRYTFNVCLSLPFFFGIFKTCCSLMQNHTVMLLMKSVKRINKIWTAYDLDYE